MKRQNKKQTRLCACLALLMIVIWTVTGCASNAPPDRFADVGGLSFHAEAEGTLNGQPICVRIFVRSSEEDVKEVRVEYLSPPVLQGMTVKARIKADAEGNVTSSQVEITYAEHTRDLSSASADGLLLPATVFLNLHTPDTIQKGELGYTLTYAQDRVLVINSDGIPTAFSSPSLSLCILEWGFD